MGAIVSFMLAGLATIAVILFGLATMNNPYNDITRAYTTLLTVLSGVVALGLWFLGTVLVGRTGGTDPENEDWHRDVER